jgi:hypothetical protein
MECGIQEDNRETGQMADDTITHLPDALADRMCYTAIAYGPTRRIHV